MTDPRVIDLVQQSAARLRRPVEVSFEFFPPNDAQMAETLWASVLRLEPLRPRFVSVTYGADGSTRERTHRVVRRIQEETPLTGAPHLTCIGATREEISRDCAFLLGTAASVISSPCAAIRCRGAVRTSHTQAASPMPRTWWRR